MEYLMEYLNGIFHGYLMEYLTEYLNGIPSSYGLFSLWNLYMCTYFTVILYDRDSYPSIQKTLSIHIYLS